MASVHDNEILSYEVDFQKRKITIKTIYADLSPVTIIEFTDVLTHVFDTQLPGSIILDVEKSEIKYFMKYNKELLKKEKGFGWPIFYKKTEDLREYLENENYNYYEILASLGLSGWVLAKNYEIYQTDC